MRTDHDCEMYFTDNQHVMVNITDTRMLVFDREGYIVQKNCPLYSTAPKILLESPIFREYKYFVLQDRGDNRISLVQEQENQSDAQVLEEPFSLESLESDLRMLKNDDLKNILNLEKIGPAVAESVKNIGDTIKLHREHILLTKSGFLILLGSCVFEHMEDHQSIYSKPEDQQNKQKSSNVFHSGGDKMEDFTYETS